MVTDGERWDEMTRLERFRSLFSDYWTATYGPALRSALLLTGVVLVVLFVVASR